MYLKTFICVLCGSTDSGIYMYMSDVVCESKMDVDDTQI